VLKSKSLKTVLPELIKYFKQANIDLLISHMSLTNIVAIMARGFSGNNFPLVAIEHNTPSIKYKNEGVIRQLIPLLMRRTYHLADTIVCVSEGVKKDLVKLLKRGNDRIITIYNPVVSKELEVKKSEKVNHKWFEEGRKVIIGIGRLEPVKNFSLLIEAFSDVYHRDNETRLIILGEGSERIKLQEKIDFLGLSNVVDMPGFVKNPYGYLSQSSLFVLSSNFEGLGMVVIEALACGTPVVATDCPSGPREILADGEYGELVPVGDKRELAKAMIRQLDNEYDRNKLQSRAKEFSVDKSVVQYENLINSLLEGRDHSA
jgi:glycosyltransferase involved in cell wall biosynthesis